MKTEPEPQICIVCGDAVGRVSANRLENFASPKDFLIEYKVIADGSVPCDGPCCSRCLRFVKGCDGLLTLFWDQVEKFREVWLEKHPCSSGGSGDGTGRWTLVAPAPAVEPEHPKDEDDIFEVEDGPDVGTPDNIITPNQATVNDGISENLVIPEEATISEIQIDDIATLSSVDLDALIPESENAVEFNDLGDFEESPEKEDSTDDEMEPEQPEPPIEKKRKQGGRPRKSGKPEWDGMKRKSYPCVECSKVVNVPLILYRHYQRDHCVLDGRHSCWDCGRSFESEQALELHLQEHLTKAKDEVVCIHCRRIVSLRNLREHQVKGHRKVIARTQKMRDECGLKYIKCRLCNFRTTVNCMMDLHAVQAHEGEQAFGCDQCGETFKNHRWLLIHVFREHLKKALKKCKDCGKEFSTNSSFEYHRKKHIDPEYPMRLCPKCGQRVSRVTMKFHLENVHGKGEKIYKRCHVCQEGIPSYQKYRKHMAHEHGIGTPQYFKREKKSCEKCGEVCKSKDYLARHMFNKHGEKMPGFKEFTCRFCPNVYHTKAHLWLHQKKFHGLLGPQVAKGLVCKECSETVPEKQGFLEHMRNVHGIQVKAKEFKKYCD